MVTHTAETVGAEKLLATTKMSTNGVNGHETGPLADNNYGPPANHPAAPQNTPIVGTPVVGVLVAASPPTTIRMTDSEYEYPEREQPANEQSRHGGESLPTACNLQDCVFIKDLQLTTVVGEDAWNRPGKPQPVLISVRVHRHISSAGANDDVDGTLSYSMVVKDIQEVVKDGEGSGGFRSASDLSHAIFEKSHGRWGAWAVFININLPKGCLRAEGGFHLASIYHEKVADRGEESMVTGIRVPCIIGVNDHERLAKQNVVISFKIVEDKSTQADAGPGTTGHWREMSSQVAQMAEASSFQTVEALATKIADHIIGADSVNFVNVSVEKPSAISFVAGSGCEVNRERNDGDHHAQVNSGPRVSLMYDDVAPSAPEEQE